MKNFKFRNAALLLCGAMMMAGCGAENEVSKIIDVSDPTLSEFSAEKLGLLKGEFYCGDEVLKISETGAILTEGSTETVLTGSFIAGEGLDVYAQYKDPNGKKYLVSFTNGVQKLLSVKVGETEKLFQPELTSIKGWYTGWGTADYGMVGYIVTNSFNKELNKFQMGSSHISYGVIPEGAYLTSHYRVIDDMVTLGVSFYFADDLEEPFENYYVEKSEETGKIDLMYEDGEDFAFESAVLAISDGFTYFDIDKADEGYNYAFEYQFLDEWDKSVYDADWNYYNYEEGFDDQGQYIDVANTRIRCTEYGITVESESGVKEMPSFMTGVFYGMEDVEFTDGAYTLSYAFDWDTWENTVLVNGVAADSFCYTIHDHQVMIEAKVGSDVYYLAPGEYEKDGYDYIVSTATMIKNNASSTGFNRAVLDEIFIRNLVARDGVTLVTIDEDLKVTMGSLETQGHYENNDTYGLILTDGNMFIVPLNDTYSLFGALSFTDESFAEVLFDIDYVSMFIGFEWKTGNVSVDLTNMNAITFNGDDATFAGFSYLSTSTENVPCISFVSGTKQYRLGLFLDGAVLYEFTQTAINLIAGLVPADLFDQAIGKYVTLIDENLGEETVTLKADGTLIVDVLNSSKTALVPTTFTYFAYLDANENVVLEIEYNGNPVNIIFEGGLTASIFGEVYLNENLYNVQGVYSDGTNVFSFMGDALMYNGKKVNWDSFKDGTLSGTFADGDIEIVFNGSKATVTIGGQLVGDFDDAQLGLADFVGFYEDVGSLGYDLKITAGAVYWVMTGEEFGLPISADNYWFAMEEGEIVLKVSYAMMNYTFKLTSSGVVATGESSLPPLPPPPPPLF